MTINLYQDLSRGVTFTSCLNGTRQRYSKVGPEGEKIVCNLDIKDCQKWPPNCDIFLFQGESF